MKITISFDQFLVNGGTPVSNIQLAANLRRLRTDHNYTQTEIGETINICRQAYSK